MRSGPRIPRNSEQEQQRARLLGRCLAALASTGLAASSLSTAALALSTGRCALGCLCGEELGVNAV